MPVQMIGTRRSGSNLLRVMIGQLPEIYTPQSTHMLEYFMPLVPYYDDLTEPQNFEMLVNDMCRCVELNPVKWEGVNLDRQEVISRCSGQTVLHAFEAIYSYAAEQTGCKDWMCKCLGYINYFQEFENHFNENMKYIYIYRDGRDVALSFLKALAGQKHHYLIAKEWVRTQKLALKIKNILPANRFHAVKYEDLITNPEAECRSIAQFLEVSFNSTMLCYYNSPLAQAAAKSSVLWGNVAKPIIPTNVKKYLKESSEYELLIFEMIAGDVLETLGYECHYIKSASNVKLADKFIHSIDDINQKRKAILLENGNPDDTRRRDIQKLYVDEVKARLGCVDVKYHGNMMHKSEINNPSDQQREKV